ncbi:DUF2235 domain-containing protein [Escherichia coli]|nr:DUF2235 domain-containing protein [Escherichia coli]HAX3824584.1 DUF2235 domain-containing protein [Escherichia coli]HCQ0564536.1 DUF2235 domain-containing protein [Escherichia coli]
MSDFHAWEASECEHFTDVNVSEKTVICKRKPVPGITITIGMFFDGTGNNAFNTQNRILESCSHLDVGMKAEDAEACAKKLGKKIDNAGSYIGYYSNIHWLNTLYATNNEVIEGQTVYQRAVYVQGIGTDKGNNDSTISMGTGGWFYGVVEKSDEGVGLIAEQISQFLTLNHGINFAIEKIQFDIFGFSRGAAAARHFVNRVRNNDKAIQQAITKGLAGRNQHGKPAGETRFLGLFDTVCAVGTISNLFDVHSGVNPGVELDLPPGIAQKVFQITAMHECRYNFSLNSIKEAWPELALPGAHSDIGGGYNPKEKEYLFLTQPQNETVSESIPSEVTDIYRRSAAEIPDLKSQPALRVILPSGEVKTETWYDYLVNEDKKCGGITQKRVGAAVTIERVVTNDWSKVSLRVMLDAAQDAGGVFNEILPKDENLTLPPELESLYEKAIDQGKTVRSGGVPTPFVSAELQLIGKYIHCSANWNPVVIKDVWLDGNKVKTIYGAVKSSDLLFYINRPNPGWLRAVWNMQGGKS